MDGRRIQAPHLSRFLILSLTIHALFLSLLRFEPPHEPVSSFKISLVAPEPLFAPEVPTSRPLETPRRPTSAAAPRSQSRSAPSARANDTAPPSAGETSAQAGEGSGGTQGISTETEGESAGTGGISSEKGGLTIGGGGGPASGGGTAPGSGASGGRGTLSGTRKSGPLRAGPPGGVWSTVEIPDSLRRSPFEGQIYTEVDRYVLRGTNLRLGITVPGTDVCLDGDRLRTKQTVTFTRIVTDMSKCDVIRIGEVEKLICAPDADREEIVFDDYLSSPVNYSVKVCLAYDRSHCSREDPGDPGSEKERCRAIRDEYQGIWAEGTMFDYRCTKSETHSYSHPLKYNIRFIRQDVEKVAGRMRPRLLLTTTRSIPPCESE